MELIVKTPPLIFFSVVPQDLTPPRVVSNTFDTKLWGVYFVSLQVIIKAYLGLDRAALFRDFRKGGL